MSLETKEVLKRSEIATNASAAIAASAGTSVPKFWNTKCSKPVREVGIEDTKFIVFAPKELVTE